MDTITNKKLRCTKYFPLLLLLVNSACSGSAVAPTSDLPQATAGSGSIPTSTIPPQASSASNSQSSVTPDIWSRRDVAPSDVINQISYASPGGAGGANPACPGFSKKETTRLIADFTSKLEINMMGVLCVNGMPENGVADVIISKPNGTKTTFALKVSTDFFLNGSRTAVLEIPAYPGDPLGIYKISVSSSTGSAQLNYEVVLAARPRGAMQSISRYQLRPLVGNVNLGDDVKLYLAGFKANSYLVFHLYRKTGVEMLPVGKFCPNGGCEKTNLEFTTIWKESSNARGEFTTSIPTARTTPLGEYLLLVSGINAPKCEAHNPFFTTSNLDWGKATCDEMFLIRIENQSAPKLPVPTATSQAAAPAASAVKCQGSLPSRLTVGQSAQVSTNGLAWQLALRNSPGKTSEKIHVIAAGVKMKLLRGPVCADGFNWWFIHSENNFEGWAPEGDHEDYWIDPLK